MKSNAVVFKDGNQVVFESVDCPDPSPDQVVVNVTHSWISNGTEGSYLRGSALRAIPLVPWRPASLSDCRGLQKVGIVDWVGASDWVVEAIRSLFQ